MTASTTRRPAPQILGETSWGSEIELLQTDVETTIRWYRPNGEEVNVAIQHFDGHREADFVIFNQKQGVRRVTTFSYEELGYIIDFLTLRKVDRILAQ